MVVAASHHASVNEIGRADVLRRAGVEIMELPDHPFFVAVQFHPELKSRPHRAHPLFRELVAAALAHQTPGQDSARG